MAFVKVGSLWIKKSEKTGKKYLSGKLELDKLNGATGNVNISVWPNDKGDNPKRPDYVIQAQVEEVAPPPADNDDDFIPLPPLPDEGEDTPF